MKRIQLTANSRASGFTVVELAVVLTIAAILVTVAVPSYRSIVQDNRRAISVNEFIAALNYARSEAVKRSVNVTVCKTSGNSCVNSGDWSQGWMIFADNNRNGVVDVGSGECIAGNDCRLKSYAGLNEDISLVGSSNIQNLITYNAKGMVGTGTGGNGTLVLCDGRGIGKHARAIDLTVTGRARSRHTEDASQVGVTDCSTFSS